MEDEGREAIEALFGKAGELVPPVDPADIRKMREYQRELAARHEGKQYAVGFEIWQQMFPEADVMAISYRCGRLWFLEQQALKPFWTGGEFSEAVFKAAATMEMKRMKVGVVYKGDEILEPFFKAVYEAAA